jgi:hypothetical protein
MKKVNEKKVDTGKNKGIAKISEAVEKTREFIDFLYGFNNEEQKKIDEIRIIQEGFKFYEIEEQSYKAQSLLNEIKDIEKKEVKEKTDEMKSFFKRSNEGKDYNPFFEIHSTGWTIQRHLSSFLITIIELERATNKYIEVGSRFMDSNIRNKCRDKIIFLDKFNKELSNLNDLWLDSLNSFWLDDKDRICFVSGKKYLK